jgi:hypothetical protein
MPLGISPIVSNGLVDIILDILVDTSLHYLVMEHPRPKRRQEALDAAKQELARCLREQARLSQRITKSLQMAVSSLQGVDGDGAEEEMLEAFTGLDPKAGITTAIQHFLAANSDEIIRKALDQKAGMFDPQAGITDTVRHFLALHSDKRLTATEIRNGLQSIGFPLQRYSNAYAVIAKVLDRLKEAGAVRISKTPRGHKVYRWKG